MLTRYERPVRHGPGVQTPIAIVPGHFVHRKPKHDLMRFP